MPRVFIPSTKEIRTVKQETLDQFVSFGLVTSMQDDLYRASPQLEQMLAEYKQDHHK